MLDDRRCRTGGGLIAPNGSDPRVQPREGAAERLDFAQRAAAIRAPLPQPLAVLFRLSSDAVLRAHPAGGELVSPSL